MCWLLFANDFWHVLGSRSHVSACLSTRASWPCWGFARAVTSFADRSIMTLSDGESQLFYELHKFFSRSQRKSAIRPYCRCLRLKVSFFAVAANGGKVRCVDPPAQGEALSGSRVSGVGQ
jgi:hypothetical protein